MQADKSNMEGEFKAETSKQTRHAMNLMHYHDFYEIYIQDSGTRDYLISSTFYKLNPRDVILLSPNILHQSVSDDVHVRSVVYFTVSFLKTYFSDDLIRRFLSLFQYEYLTLTPEYYYQAAKTIREMKEEQISEEHNRIFVKLADLFMILLRSVLENPPPLRNSTVINIQNPVDGSISPLITYVHENYLSFTSIEEIASTFYMSPSHLCRSFKKMTGYTIVHYINMLKIQQACGLLCNTDKSITDIALDCGFHSTVYFCKTFKSLVSLTPTEYRNVTKKSILL